jgi:hypothetical protein
LLTFDIEGRRDGHGGSGTRFSLTYSAVPSPLWRLRPVRRPRRRVQPPLQRLRAAEAAHEPRVMIVSQCNVHTAICVQYRVGATAAQAGSDKETPISKIQRRTRNSISKHKASISYTNIQGAFVDIDKSSISGYNNIKVLIFEIDVSSISNCVDIEVPRFDIEDFSISYWINILC